MPVKQPLYVGLALGALCLVPTVHAAFVSTNQEASEESPAERKGRKVRELLDLNATAEIQRRSVDQTIERLVKQGMPEAMGEKFKERFDVDQLLDLLVPVFVEHMDEEALDAALDFYKTPVGQAYAEAAPDIQFECMRIANEYREEIGEEITQSK